MNPSEAVAKRWAPHLSPTRDESEGRFDEASPTPPTPAQTEEALTSELRGHLLQIHGDKEIQGSDKAAAIGAAVVAALKRRGRFYHHRELKDFKTAMFFDSFGKRLSKLQSDSFLAWVSDLVCISRSDWRFPYIRTAMENAAIVDERSLGIIP
ncbi:MAG TPA: hypothetical protein PLX89_07515 [Verrucomicrobiota bacterium]|nr:hypothetical protein [Verrucomicrobiales bacterium]HRI12837.1 hypothetical protein [Verrucomicrobiota bacterium]